MYIATRSRSKVGSDTEARSHRTLTIHTRAAAQTLSAGHDRRASTERRALPADVELHRLALRTEVVQVARGLRVQGVVARARTGFYHEDAERRVRGRKTSSKNTTGGAAWRSPSRQRACFGAAAGE